MNYKKKKLFIDLLYLYLIKKHIYIFEFVLLYIKFVLFSGEGNYSVGGGNDRE